jgi:hypothetical protein
MIAMAKIELFQSQAIAVEFLLFDSPALHSKSYLHSTDVGSSMSQLSCLKLSLLGKKPSSEAEILKSSTILQKFKKI